MPSRPPKVGGDGPLLKTWRQEGSSGARAKLWLSARRLAAIMIALVLVGILAYLMLSPLLLPKTYFAYLCTDELPPLVVASPIEFAGEDFAGFLKLQDAFASPSSKRKSLAYGPLMSTALLQAEIDVLKQSAITNEDALILFVSAHGIVRDGKAYLICGDFDPSKGNDNLDGLYSVTKLLRQIAEVPGTPKLLLLDATRSEYAPRLGMVDNSFTEVFKQEMESLSLPSVWVLNSSSPGEKSHVSPALRRSVFGYMCAIGLQGAADTNDDREVQLGEFADFVRFNVSEWVKQSTGDAVTQTPMLLNAGGNQSLSKSAHLLYTANLPEVEPVSSALISAQDSNSRSGIVNAVQEYMSGEVDEFGVRPIFTAIGTVAGKLGLNSGEKGESNDNATGTNNTQNDTSPRQSQNEIELDLFEQAWKLTAKVAEGLEHPANYAPQLWRLHMERLVWLENRQQAGERMNQLPLIDELRGLIQSLKNFEKLDLEAPKEPNVVDRLRLSSPAVPLEAADAPTLALAEAITASDPKQVLPDKLLAFVSEYDTWLGNSEGMDRLDAIKETHWNGAWNNYYEFQLFDAYRDDTDIPPDVAKLAFDVRRLGEQVTANLFWGQGWAAATVDDADRFRLEAERLLQDHASSQWLEKSRDNLHRARTLYANAQTTLTAVQHAAHLQRETMCRVRDYLRWCRYCWGDSASRAPSAQRIEGLLVSLRDLRDALEVPDRSRAPNLSDLQRIQVDIERQLAQSVEEIASSYEPGNLQRMSALLQTSLLTSAQRSKLIKARFAADDQMVRSFVISRSTSTTAPPPTSSTKRKLAVDQIKTELKLLEIFWPTANDWPSFDNPELVDTLAASKLLGDRLYELNGVVESEAGSNANLTDRNRRGDRLRRLRRASQGLFLIDALDASIAEEGGKSSHMQQLRNAMWYDLLSTARERFKNAQVDAIPRELTSLRVLANQCGKMASKIPNQPEILNLRSPQLALKVENQEAQLIVTDEATINFTVQSFGQNGPVWVVAQYDPRVIDVSGANWTILKEEEIKNAAVDTNARTNADYPYWPKARRGVAETMTLAAGQSRDLAVKVRRSGNARGNTNLVIKAIGNTDFLRQQIPIRLPGQQDLELTIAGARTIRGNLEGKIGLFANRSQDFTINLANRGSDDRTIVASLYAPQQAANVSIPTGSIESAAAEQILRRMGNRTAVALGSTPLVLPPGGAAQSLQFDFQTPENKSILGATPTGGPVRIHVPHGLILDIVDEKTREHTIRWLQFEVWRPRAFLNAHANFDPGSRRLTITAEVIDPASCPNGEIHLKLDLDRQFVSARGGGTYETFLKAPNYRGELETTLTGRWPQDFDPLAPDHLPVRVSVDDYPRGFEFRVPKTTTPTDLQPTRDQTSLRIIAPSPNQAFPASNTIDARVEVDVPEGFFNIPNSFIEIGIDRNQDRELRDEESVKLFTDRQLELYVKLPNDNGTLAFEPRVNDFNLNLRTAGISDRQINVLGQLTTAGRISERTYVPIVLDGEGPDIGVVKLIRDGTILKAELNPQDLTGIRSVEAAIESSTEVKWEPGKQSAGGQWFAELDTSQLSPGEYTVLLRATDNVGNTCDVVSTPWTNDPVEQAKDLPKETVAGIAPKVIKNQVKGRLTYGSQQVTKIEVTLIGATAQTQLPRLGSGGTFDFGLVPSGTYTLKARGLAGGNYHSADMQVTVSDQPETPLELEVKIR